jgi:hypothetical protein
MEVIDVSSGSHYRSARCENVSVGTRPELVHCCLNGVFMNPAFNHQDICTDPMRYREKRVNAPKNESASQY